MKQEDVIKRIEIVLETKKGLDKLLPFYIYGLADSVRRPSAK